MPDNAATTEIETPAGKPRGLALVFTWRILPLIAARVGILVARMRGKPFRIGNTVLAIRYAHVREVLSRDLDFIIQPINGPRFDGIGYHFILGMDRSPELAREREVLYAALSRVPMDAVRHAAQTDIDNRLKALGTGQIDVVEDYARPVAAATARTIFGIVPADNTQLMDVARAIFAHCFLNVTNDPVIAARADAAAALLTGWIGDEIARRRGAPDVGHDMMGQLLRGGADDDLTRRTLGGMFVGSIDTTATAVAKIMVVMIADEKLRLAATRDATDLTRLYGWCQEALRRWPQTPLLARQSSGSTSLAGTVVPSGAKVLLWIQAAMFDPTAFPDPGVMRPDRTSTDYLHLGGGLHPCAGRGITAWQVAMLVGGLLKRRPETIGKIDWAGPFPAHLPLQLRGAVA